MNIDKEKLKERFSAGDWTYVYTDAATISDFLATSYFKILDKEVRSDIVQDCCIDLFKQVSRNKVDPTKNIFSFIWKNSSFRIRDAIKKEAKRREKVEFTNFSDLERGGRNIRV